MLEEKTLSQKPMEKKIHDITNCRERSGERHLAHRVDF